MNFWSSLVGTLVGVGLAAVLGVAGAFLVGLHFVRDRRNKIAKAVRNAIATESIYNLITLSNIERRTRTTLDSDFSTRSYHEFRPRDRLLQQLLTPDTLTAISSQEAGALVVTAPELEHLAASYEEWMKMIALDRPDQRLVAKEKTRILLYLIRKFGSNVLGLLITICHRRGRDLLDENAQRIAEALSPIQVGRPANFTKSLRSSHLKDASNLKQMVDEKSYLVVWEHDWPDCPIEVIELKKHVDPKVIRYSE